MLTLAVNDDGTGKSKVFIASDEDLQLNSLPDFLIDKISFIRIVPWNWVSKKGTGGDIQGMDNTWFYKWNNQAISDLHREFIPMSWGYGGANDDDDINLYRSKYKVTHVLGFNEPDDCNGQSGQYNNLCDVNTAVGVYKNLMKTGLRLVSPACRQGAVFNWLNLFNQEAIQNDIRIDVIALHWYDWGGNPQDSPNADPNTILNRFKTYLNDVYALYGLPIWITEFNGNKYRSIETNRQFMELAVSYLEGLDFVERYAWFQPQGVDELDDPGNAEFFDEAMNLTDIGTFYKNHQSTASIPAPFYIGPDNLNNNSYLNNFVYSCDSNILLSLDQNLPPQNYKLKIYPNPTSEIIKILISQEIKNINIYSINGVQTKIRPQNEYIDVSNLKKGVYIIKVNQYYSKFLKL